MHTIHHIKYAAFAVVFLLALFSGCTKPGEIQTKETPVLASFRDVSGITEAEIKAIEALQKQNLTLIYGETLGIELFVNSNGEIDGYAALLCDWLTGFFGIQFKPVIYQWSGLLNKLDTHEIAFCSLLASNERLKSHFMTDPIVERSAKIVRIHDSLSFEKISMSRPVRYAFRKESASFDLVAEVLTHGDYEYIMLDSDEEVYRVLENGRNTDGSPDGADAFVDMSQATFEDHPDLYSEDFLPLIFIPMSMATKDPELLPIVTVINKALKGGAIQALNELNKTGHENYMRTRFLKQLTEEEKAYIQNTAIVPVLAENWFYPLNFYNKYEKKWDGIAFDVLDEIAKLTGLTFRVANAPDAPWAEMYEMMNNGEVSISLDLIYTPERRDRFLWSKHPYLSENYALLSKHNFPNISIGDILYAKIGLIKSTGYAEMFNTWFPNAANVTTYETQDDTFLALDRGEIDLVMAGTNALSSVTNYYELSNYKANYIFNSAIDYVLVFNKEQPVLFSIIEKALPQIGIKTVSKRWESKTFDYQSKLMREQRPLLSGAIFLSLLILVLVFILFMRSRVTGIRLEKLVKIRTSELENKTSKLAFQTTLLQTMINSIPDHIFCKDLNLHYTMCNKFLLDSYHLDMNSIIGKGDTDGLKLSEEEAHKANEIDQKVINEGQNVVYEECLEFPNGSKRIFETIKAPLMQNGAVIGMVGIAHDITERKIMEEKAIAASQSKSDFLANMSHELRTPLNVVIGLTDLVLEENHLAAHVSNNLSKIRSAGETLLSIVNDILDISKIESGKFTLIPSEYHISSLINDVITLVTTRLNEKPVTFQLNINDDLPRKLYGDDLRVKQVLNNLLSNAIKHTNTGTIELAVNCIKDTEYIWMEILVSDTGIGIRDEDLKNLFSDYYQVETKANRRNEGTGLGLSITKKFVEMMDGEISAESEYGKGTTFRVRLRQGIVDNETIGAAVADSLRTFHYSDDKRLATKKLERPDLRYARVLVVDDMQTNLDVATGLLRKYKMQVDCVLNGPEAIERIRYGKPYYNAIFMDHMMPEMDGLETTDAIRAIDTEYARQIPVIALTANAIQGTISIFYEHDFQDFVSKPIDIIQLDYVIRKWIRNVKREENKNTDGIPEESEPVEEDAILDIPGLDMEKGLALYDNDKEFYIIALRSFTANTPAVLDKLRNVTEDTLHDYVINVHGLKSTSASIGAEITKNTVLTLESMAKSGDLEGVLLENENFIKDTENVIGNIKSWLEKQDNKH